MSVRKHPVALLVALLVTGCASNDAPPATPEGTEGIALSSTGSSGVSEPDAASGKLDLASDDSGGPPSGSGACPEGGPPGGEHDFSYIWIANSPEGTVSKIDTATAQEVARYRTGPEATADDPSRTAVNLQGDVVVTNRGGQGTISGSVTKIAATEDRCIDFNGDDMIETSQGADDVLAWGEDECVLWRHEVPSRPAYSVGPRPTAWDAGDDPCSYGDDRVWVGWYDDDNQVGEFRRLDGQDGTLLDEVHVPGWVATRNNHGPYGGAIDGNNDFWVIGLAGPLVRIDGDSLDHERWEVPVDTSPYGIAIDEDGHPWLAGQAGELSHFDPVDESWEVFHVEPDGSAVLRGLQVDREGQVWAARNGPCGLVQFDIATGTFVETLIELPGCGQPVGVSVDALGRVWVPDRNRDLAYRYDPVDHETATVEGLVSPYTYSDMTGAGLALAWSPPEG